MSAEPHEHKFIDDGGTSCICGRSIWEELTDLRARLASAEANVSMKDQDYSDWADDKLKLEAAEAVLKTCKGNYDLLWMAAEASEAALQTARADADRLADALDWLMTWQNGPPLETYTEPWNHAMESGRQRLDEHAQLHQGARE
jgi:hypothetical protein